MGKLSSLKFIVALVLLTLTFQNCGGVKFQATETSPQSKAASPGGQGRNLDGGGAPGGPISGLDPVPPTVSGHGPVTVVTPGTQSPAASIYASICNLSSESKKDWSTSAVTPNLPNLVFEGHSGSIQVDQVQDIKINGSSGQSFVIESAETMSSYSGNSGNLLAKVRDFKDALGNSGSIELVSQNVGNIKGSSGHICVSAQSINAIEGSSSTGVAISPNSVKAGNGKIERIIGSSSSKTVIMNMQLTTALGNSGELYIQGGHVGMINGQSGNIYLDGVTVDQIVNSSGNIYLLNGAQVLN